MGSLEFAVVLNIVISVGFIALATITASRALPRWLKTISLSFYYILAARHVIGALQQISFGKVNLTSSVILSLSLILAVLVWVLALVGASWEHRNLLPVKVEHAAWIWDFESDEIEWCDNLRVEMNVPVDLALTRAWVSEHLHPNDRDKTWPTAKPKVDRNLPFDFDYRLIRDDGRIVRHVGKATPVSKNGKIVAYIGVLNFELL